MYHNKTLSQHLFALFPPDKTVSRFKTFYNQKRLRDLVTKPLVSDIAVLTKKRRGYGTDILEYFLKFKNAPYICIANATIAKEVGCNERTVQNWTSRFVREGILLKRQEDRYVPNSYALSVTRQTLYSYGLSQLTEKQQEHYIRDGMIPMDDGALSFQHETFTPNYSYIYIKANPFPGTNSAHAREEVLHGFGAQPTRDLKKEKKMGEVSAGAVYATQKERALAAWFAHEQYSRVVRGIKMLKEEQKKYIQKHKKMPQMREMFVQDPNLKKALFSPMLLKLSTLLELKEEEQLKMIAFDDLALETVYNEAEKIKSGANGVVNDRVGWLFSQLTKASQAANLKPNWHWYYDVAEILSIDTKAKSEPRPFGSKKIFQKAGQVPGHAPMVDGTTDEYRRAVEYKPDTQQRLDRELDRAYLETEISRINQTLSEPEKYFKFAVADSMEAFKKDLVRYTEKLSMMDKE